MALFPITLILISTGLHAWWNLLAHSRRSDAALFLRANLLLGGLGLVPIALIEFQGNNLPLEIWPLLIATGFFQAVYCFGLIMGYRSGDFSMVYPLARALPVLALALFDFTRDNSPSVSGWLGIMLVTIGCFLAPLKSLRRFNRDYFSRALFWVFIIAAGTVGYTTVDKIAMETLRPGIGSVLHYSVYQWLLTVPFLWLGLRYLAREKIELGGSYEWRGALLAAVLMSSAYVLILWVYQMIPQASYVVALRQFSIVIGVVAAIIILREEAAAMRLTTALIITCGVVLVSLA